jgi:hypothetical protein
MAVPAGLLKGDEDAFGIVVAAQWPSRARPTGAAALALALLTNAAREAGLAAITDKRVRPGQRAAAQAYLAGRSDGSEPLPLETACALVGLDVRCVKRAMLRRLGPGDGP